MTAHLADAHLPQHFSAGLFGQIKINDGEIGTWGSLRLDGVYKLDRLLAVRDDDEITFYAMLFECFADKPGVGGIVLYKQNGDEVWARDQSAFRGSGL